MTSKPESPHRPLTLLLGAVLSVSAGGLAAAQSPEAVPQAAPEPASVVRSPGDPLEPLNRSLYAVHRDIDRAVVRPLMSVYMTVTPKLVRSGLRNAVGNLGEPITFVNDVLQVRPRRAGRTLTRFATNSTIGLLGVFDLAADAGFPRHYSDFGQTLGRYGVGPGPYLFVPVLGPSSARDLLGRVVDMNIDPVSQAEFRGDTAVSIVRPVVYGLELRAYFDQEISRLDTTATDPYVTLRSAYMQNRRFAIRGEQVDVESLPSFDPEPADAAQ